MKATKSVFMVIVVFTLLFSTIGQVSGKSTDSENPQISEIPPYIIFLPLVMNGKGPVQSAPYPAANPSPADGAREVILNPSLMWIGSDPDGDALVYDVYFGLNNPPTTSVANHQSTSSFVPSLLKGNTYYFWKVVSFDTHGASTASPVWHFTTLNLPPDPAANPSPANMAVDQSLTPTLSWTGSDPDSDYLRYNVYLDASNPNPTTRVANLQSATTFSPSIMLTANTVYYWKVLSVDSDSAFTSSPVWRFITIATPENMVLVPAGEFQMGCDEDHNGGWGCDNAIEGPKHTIYLNAFLSIKPN